MQFTTSSSSPYQYIHSKISVVDSSKVWIGSGNWKSSSLPSDGSGNRDWGIIVNSVDLATIVLERMAFDEDPVNFMSRIPPTANQRLVHTTHLYLTHQEI